MIKNKLSSFLILFLFFLTGLVVICGGQKSAFAEKADDSSAQIPPFYLMRRIFKVKGRSILKPYKIDEHGKLVPAPGYTKPQAPGTDPSPSLFLNKNSQGALVSASGKYEAVIYRAQENAFNTDSDTQHCILEIKDSESGKTYKSEVKMGWSFATALGWHPKYDLFFVLNSGLGTSDSRCREFVSYYDVENKRLVEIGGCGGVTLSPDGEWALLSESDWGRIGNETVVSTNLSIFNFKERKRINLTSGVSDNEFIAWTKK